MRKTPWWRRCCRAGPGSSSAGVVSRRRPWRAAGAVVRRFLAYTNEYPWRWTAAHLDEWSADLAARGDARQVDDAHLPERDRLLRAVPSGPAVPVGRGVPGPVRHRTRPGSVSRRTPGRTWWTTRAGPDRRPLTRDELQRFFDYADGRVEQGVRAGRKGALAAYRDATVFKVLYAWGLRCNEACRAGRRRLVSQPAGPGAGRVGQAGGPLWQGISGIAAEAPHRPQRHAVGGGGRAGLPGEHPVAVRLPRQSCDVADRAGRPDPAPAHRGTLRRVPRRPAPSGRTCSALPRHSHVSHQIEDGADPTFVQYQVGHRFQSTTAIYTGVSGDYMNTMMRKALDIAFTAAEQEDPR